MRFLAGIDEAGYGPLLGPLVVTAAVFRLGHPAQADMLWNFTKSSTAREAKKSAGCVMVADSKVVFRGKYGFARAEETVFAFLSLCSGERPRTLAGLLETLSAAEGGEYPWYEPEKLELPRVAWTNVAEKFGRAVAGDLAAHKISFEGASAAVIRAGEFNRLVSEKDNKSLVEWTALERLLMQLYDRHGKEGVKVYVDRLGGRMRYGPLLYAAFGDSKLKITDQTPERSAYVVSGGGRKMEIIFEQGADDKHFPVALASIFSKYVRELHVAQLNGYFRALMPELKPTAGYVQDGRRFLADTEDLRRGLETPEHLLVRSR